MGCRHRDDPEGTIDFRVDVGQGDDQVRFADGLTVPVQTSRDQITFKSLLKNEPTSQFSTGISGFPAQKVGSAAIRAANCPISASLAS
ncbi:hypothetical protein VB777_10295, partial [Synechococcus sp. CCY9202]|nr:hypothetical protein [Synechococcus sp. CCY9202]